MEDITIDDIKKDPKMILVILREVAPALYTIARLNEKLLKEMKYGEIHLTQHVRAGKIYKVDATPKISELIES